MKQKKNRRHLKLQTPAVLSEVAAFTPKPAPPLTIATFWPNRHGHISMLTQNTEGKVRKHQLI